MKEEFLHYLWKYSLYDRTQLFDNEGNRIVVVSPGEYNRDSGPDFFNARLKIGPMEWAGNIEIHLKASHFVAHGHNTDPSYDNVILHVVGGNDKSVYNSKGNRIPSARLVYDSALYEKYLNLINNPSVIACESEIGSIDSYLLHQWLSALSVERMQEKLDHVMTIFRETGNDWEETFYRLLSRYFGFRVNTGPFEMLASSLPLKIIRRHSDNLLQAESLLFGTAGLLEEGLFREAVNDEYYLQLLREFRMLSSKYSLRPLHGWIWKFARLRPVNFPTIRISQLAGMLTTVGGLFSKVLGADDIISLKKIFEVSASDYWTDHYVFGKKSRPTTRVTGTQATDILLINAVIPSIFAYGHARDSQEIVDRALAFLEAIDPEVNTITSEWKSAGIRSESAFLSQALLQLRNNYCKKRRCLDCMIGSRLVSQGKVLRKDEELMLEP